MSSSTTTTDKHSFFFSRACEKCKSAALLIQQRGLRDRFYFVNVEQYKNQLPNFITTVPLVYTLNSEVLTGEDLFMFIRHLKQQQPEQPQQYQQPPEIEGFELSTSNSSLSDAFSFIDTSSSLSMRGGFDAISPSPSSPHPQQQQKGVRENVSPPTKLPNGAQFPKPIETRKIVGDFSADLDRFKAIRDNEVTSNGPRVF